MAPDQTRINTGITGLDDVLNGGLLRHRLYLVEGIPGSGKTTLALQFLLAGVAAGERCLYVTLSETEDELMAGAASHGWQLDGLEILELGTDESDLSADAHLTMYQPSEVELNETTKVILEAVQRLNPTRVVLDSLSEMRLMAQSPLRYRRQILALKQFFVGRQCTVLLLDDESAEASDLQLHSLVHGVIALEQAAPIYGPDRRRVRVRKFRGTTFRAGYHDFSIERGGLRVFPRLVPAEHTNGHPIVPVSSGVAALDALLGGGPDRGTSTLLMGPAGTGKSTIALQYAVAAAARGDQAAMFLFDEAVPTLHRRAEAVGIHLREAVAAGRVHLRAVDAAEMSPGEFVHLVRLAVERDDARIVVIDSINGFMNAMPDERCLIVHLHELLAYLGRRGVTTFLNVAQHGLVGTGVSAPVDTSYLADSVVLLRFFEAHGQVKKAISVIKKRSGAHEDTIRELCFTSTGVQLSEPLTHLRGVLSGMPVEIGA